MTGDRLPEEFHRYLCDSAGIALLAIDPDLRIRYCNPEAGRVFGAEPRVLLDTPFLSIFPNEGRNTAERFLRQALDEREAGQFEFSHASPQGPTRELSVTVSPILDSGGHSLGASACIRDITQRIQLQRELDRVRKLSSMGEMAGALAQHFNNILGGIITSVDFALSVPDPAFHQRALRNTAQSLSQAAQIVENLRAFAEGVHKESDLGDLRETIFTWAELAEPTLKKAGIELVMDIQPLPITPVPRASILTVFNKLIQNVWEAMPKGGVVRLDVALNGRWIEMRLTDQGPGISAENMERIFEPFFTTKSTGTGPMSQHPGLGLAVVHGIMKDIGGEVGVESPAGKGTTVILRLPAPA